MSGSEADPHSDPEPMETDDAKARDSPRRDSPSNSPHRSNSARSASPARSEHSDAGDNSPTRNSSGSSGSLSPMAQDSGKPTQDESPREPAESREPAAASPTHSDRDDDAPKSRSASPAPATGSQQEEPAADDDDEDLQWDEESDEEKKEEGDEGVAKATADSKDDKSDAGSDDAELRDVFGSDSDDHDAPAPAPEAPTNKLDVELTRLPRPQADQQLTYVKLPASLSFVDLAFDPATFDDHRQSGDYVRWRMIENSEGKLVPQSNARFVRWSDGSMTMHVGSEVLDATVADFEGSRNQLFAREIKGGDVVQCQGVLRNKFVLKPSSMHSDMHRKLTTKMIMKSDRHERRTAVVTALQDAMTEKRNLEKLEDERIRRQSKVEAGRRRADSAYGSKLTRKFMEPDYPEEEEYDRNSPPRKRSRVKGGGRKYGSDSEEASASSSGSDSSAGRRKRKGKGKAASSSSSSSAASSPARSSSSGSGADSESSEEPEIIVKKGKAKRRVPDSDSD